MTMICECERSTHECGSCHGILTPPRMLPPPVMKKSTGKPPGGGGVVGVHMARYRQSSDEATLTRPDVSFWSPLSIRLPLVRGVS